MNSGNNKTALPAIVNSSAKEKTNAKPLKQRPGSASAIISSARSIINQKSPSKPSTPVLILRDKKLGIIHLPKGNTDNQFQPDFKSAPSPEIKSNSVESFKKKNIPKAALNLYEVIGLTQLSKHPKQMIEQLDGISTPAENSTIQIRRQLRQSVAESCNINLNSSKAISRDKENKPESVAKNTLTFGNTPLTARSYLKIHTIKQAHSNTETVNTQNLDRKKLSVTSQSFS